MEAKGLSKKYVFKEAVPVWEKGKEYEKNRSLVFSCVIEGNDEITIKIASHSRYQIFVNGVFYAAGPARACHDYYRVSEYTLKKELSEKSSAITVIAAGYNINSFYLLDKPSFLCAEIIRGNDVLFATGRPDCNAFVYSERLVKTPRFSFQRPFTECYRIGSNYGEVLNGTNSETRKVTLSETENKSFIERNVPYCLYTERDSELILSKGRLEKLLLNKKKFKDRSLVGICDTLKGFEEKELEASPVNELYSYKAVITENVCAKADAYSVDKNGFVTYDMGRNNTGYIRLRVCVPRDAVIYVTFNEVMPDGASPDPGKDGCENVIKWSLEGNREYDLVSFEPYTFRYIKVCSLHSDAIINGLSLYEECYPENLIVNRKKMPTQSLQKIYDAAVETFRQNATDIFMDCPSRERAGWLCDSFFTSRVEKELTEKSLVEHNFLENFILPESFNDIPDGMLPMCYPADHYDNVYIHNWAFWYVLELAEYLDRTNDRKLVDCAKDKVYRLLDFTKKYENSDGLLQHIESWVFVEWSEANDFVQDINYPSNMLYSKVLDSVAELYGDTLLHEKAERLRKTIIEKSFDGEFFCDNAEFDKNGVAVRTRNRTETCQYYAFFTGTATKESFIELYKKMFTQFGPDRKNNNLFPDIPFSNAFIGNYLRLFILFSDGEYEKLLREIESFFLPMAEKTGTLWENMTDYASCCHGFASHVAYWLNKIIGD